ncbi:hypothetical protein TSUD_18660 [Trifolium subterraneum]|uniref:Uncharacterized protein n=1 Tax=Trifolium subterraneum TaxID=3900 RepID=A0A2Z6MCP9_TRISU|nr:hypothetical protein TSUD_18660 [Trifolium subterraneum]
MSGAFGPPHQLVCQFLRRHNHVVRWFLADLVVFFSVVTQRYSPGCFVLRRWSWFLCFFEMVGSVMVEIFCFSSSVDLKFHVKKEFRALAAVPTVYCYVVHGVWWLFGGGCIATPPFVSKVFSCDVCAGG